MTLMRLSDVERRALVQAVTASDPEAQVWLHGSRVRDDARGGDIDLLVLSSRMRLEDKLDVLTRLRPQLGDQRIDITLARDNSPPFVRLVLDGAVRL